MVESLVAYCREVETTQFTVLDRVVDVLDDVAMATYVFQVEYVIAGRTYEEISQEVLSFARDGSDWRAKWRTQVRRGDDGTSAPE